MAERMREIATLRVLGYNPWQIGGLMLRESMLVDLLGTTLGLPLGYLLYLLMAAAYDMELIRLPVVVPPWVWIWTVVLAIAFGVAAHLVVQWKIHHIRWLEALQISE
jgi:putative ABC transport system permease protein